MNSTELKTLFRRNLKVVAGGPAVGTPGNNRTQGLLNALDALADVATAPPASGAQLHGVTLAEAQAQALAGQLVVNELYEIEFQVGNNSFWYVRAETPTNFELVGWTVDNNDEGQYLIVDIAKGTARPVGLPFTTYDLLALTGAQMEEVIAFAYTNGDAPLAGTPAWSKPGMWFDALVGSAAYRYTCGRGNYTPGVAGSGVGPRWSRIAKA